MCGLHVELEEKKPNKTTQIQTISGIHTKLESVSKNL